MVSRAFLVLALIAFTASSYSLSVEKENNHQNSKLDFYGSSFITDETGAIVEEANRKDEAILLHEFDLDAIDEMRMSWGIFRDRRP